MIRSWIVLVISPGIIPRIATGAFPEIVAEFSRKIPFKIAPRKAFSSLFFAETPFVQELVQGCIPYFIQGFMQSFEWILQNLL